MRPSTRILPGDNALGSSSGVGKGLITAAHGDIPEALALLDQWQPHNGSRAEVEMLALRALLFYRDGQLARAPRLLHAAPRSAVIV